MEGVLIMKLKLLKELLTESEKQNIKVGDFVEFTDNGFSKYIEYNRIRNHGKTPDSKLKNGIYKVESRHFSLNHSDIEKSINPTSIVLILSKIDDDKKYKDYLIPINIEITDVPISTVKNKNVNVSTRKLNEEAVEKLKKFILQATNRGHNSDSPEADRAQDEAVKKTIDKAIALLRLNDVEAIKQAEANLIDAAEELKYMGDAPEVKAAKAWGIFDAWRATVKYLGGKMTKNIEDATFIYDLI